MELIRRIFPGGRSESASLAFAASPGAEASELERILAVMPPQDYAAAINADEALAALAALAGRSGWCHYYDLGNGVTTISHGEIAGLRKSLSLRKLAMIVREIAPLVTRRGAIEGLSVLDLACAEGQHAIELAVRGATALGIEGRELYVERARFIARAFDLEARAKFRQGDVRRVTAAEVGTHELVIFSGILHHLGPDDFRPMLDRLAELTDDTLVLYTHTGCPAAVQKWKLDGPIEIDGGYRGYLYREHPAGISDEQKLGRMRSSLDNEFSFWVEESSLLRALRDVGFAMVTKLLHPSIFGDPLADYRPVLVCRKAAG